MNLHWLQGNITRKTGVELTGSGPWAVSRKVVRDHGNWVLASVLCLWANDNTRVANVLGGALNDERDS